MVKLLRKRGREQEADEAYVKLREVCNFRAVSSKLLPLSELQEWMYG